MSGYARLVVKITLQRSQGDGKYYIVQQEDFYQPEVKRNPCSSLTYAKLTNAAGHSVPHNTLSWTAFNTDEETGNGWMRSWCGFIWLAKGVVWAELEHEGGVRSCEEADDGDGANDEARILIPNNKTVLGCIL